MFVFLYVCLFVGGEFHAGVVDINTEYTFEAFICLAVLKEHREKMLACKDVAAMYNLMNGQVVKFTVKERERERENRERERGKEGERERGREREQREREGGRGRRREGGRGRRREGERPKERPLHR